MTEPYHELPASFARKFLVFGLSHPRSGFKFTTRSEMWR